MNFKTTVVLIVLLAVAGIVLMFTRDHGADEKISTDKKQKVMDVAASDVKRIAITSADGKKLAMEKAGTEWRMTQPVSATAQPFEVDGLIRAITDLESRGEITADSKSTGLANPRYTIELATSDGKDRTLLVGEKTAVGDNLYVSRKDNNQTQVVAADLLEKLEQQPSSYRDPKLLDLTTTGITRLEIARPEGKIVLARTGADWNIIEPSQMPAEKTDVDDILMGLTGLRATEFVSENGADAAAYQLDRPRITATLSTTQPAHGFVTTAPTTATSQPAPVVIKFGGYDDIMKKNVMVMTSESPVIAKVPASALDSLNKKPIELRDRKVMDLDSAQVSSIKISSDIAATTRPTSRPASKSDVTLRRRKQAPATAPTTKPAATTRSATTQASTQPATQAATQPVSRWELASGDAAKAADDSKVDSLLTQLHPLRAQKCLEKAPTTQPTANYVLKVTTQAAGGAPPVEHELKLVDPGNSQPLIGTYNGLAFEVERSLLDRFSGDFLPGAKPAASGLPGAEDRDGQIPQSIGP
jgi:hypothetical protein